ncbi:MAG: hemin-degrading factor [Alphaproteobacteria bacterium]|nr:hemin-degrading factor [Alphaproteobacteria bacterium]MCW5740847.1 hemin-degrading factor [Alphaproteobacteria bacterium]
MQGTGNLGERYAAYKTANPNVRIRDAAAAIGSSEAELVALNVGRTATRLRAPLREIIAAAPGLGRVMCLTRNDNVVHERKGRFEDVRVQPPHGLVLGPDIDLRIFFSRWHSGFALAEPTDRGERLSLQFFDRDGMAVFKIYATDGTDRAAWAALVEKMRAPDQDETLVITPYPADEADRPDSEIVLDALRTDWRALRDTHDFFPMLKKHKVGRVQALRLVGEEFVRRLPNTSARAILESVAAAATPIMIFVGSPGCIQIHSGPVKKLMPTGPWFNVLDPDFNLHLRESAIASVFHVRKPTEDGEVNSIELYDARNRQMALIFGARKPGKPELPAWREAIAGLSRPFAA